MIEPVLNLLLVDDEDSIREPLSQYLHTTPYFYEVTNARNYEEAIQAIEEKKSRFDVALVDEVLGDGPGGLEILKYIKLKYPEIEVILFTGWGLKSGEEVREIGAYSYVPKPFNPSELALMIYNAAERKRIRREREYLSSLVNVSREFTQTTDLEKQMAIVWNYVREQLGTPTFFIALYDSEKDTLQFHQSYDEGESNPLPDRNLGPEPSEWGVVGYVVKTGQEQVWFDHDQAVKKWQELGITPHISGRGSSESGICIPLKTGKKTLGVLSIQSYQKNAFDRSFLDAVRTLSSQVAPAIDNAKLFLEGERIRTHMEGLIASSLDAVISIDSNRRVTVFNKQAEEMFGYASNEMMGKKVAILYEKNDEAREIWDIVHAQGKIVRREVSFKHKNGTKIPVILSAISIRNIDGGEIGQAGFMHARLVVDQLRALIDANRAISNTLERKTVLQQIMDSAIAAFPAAEKGAIHLYDERKGELVAEACKGYSDEVAKFVTLKPGEGRAGWVFEQNEPLVVQNVHEDELSIKVDSKIGHREVSEQKSTICVPLRIKGKVIGTLSLDNVSFYDAFRGEDIELLSTFADQAATAIDNSLRMQELEYMQRSTAALANALEPRQVLEKIVEGASEVLQADSAAVLSFDDVRNQVIPEELVAYGITKPQLERFQKQTPKQGGTADTVMERDWIGVADIFDSQYDFLGSSTLNLLNSIGTKSFMGIALKVGEERLGILYVNYNRSKDFTSEDQKKLETFANHAAIALKKARLSDQIKQARDAAAVIAQIVALEKDVQSTWSAIVEGTSRALSCDAVVLYRYNEDSGELGYPPAIVGVNFPDRVASLPTVPENSMIWKVLRNDDLLIVDDTISDDSVTRNRRFTIEEGIKSLVGIPLKVGGQRVGVMFVNYRNKHRFTQDELTHIKLFANQIAVAIRNTQLLERTKKQADTLEGLHEAGKAVTSLLESKIILERIADQAWHLIGKQVGHTVIRLVSNDIAAVAAAYPKQILTEKNVYIPEIDLISGLDGRIGITGRAIKTGESQLVNDVTLDKDYIPSSPEVRSELAVPIKIGGQVIGVINVDSPEVDAFDENDRKTLLSLSGFSAIAMKNARRVAQIEHLLAAAGDMARAENVHEMLKKIVVNAKKLMEADYVAIWEYNPLRQNFIPNGLMHSGSIDESKWRLPQQGGIAYAILERGILSVQDVANDQSSFMREENRKYLIKAGIQSFIGVALKAGEEELGVLYVDYSSRNVFGVEQLQTINTFANQAAFALKNIRFLDQQNRARKASRIVAELTVLGDLKKTLEYIVDGAKEALQCDVVTLYTYNQDTGEFGFPPAMQGVDEKSKESMLSGVTKQSVVQKILVLDDAYLAEDAASDKLMQGPFVIREKIKSSIGIPLKVGGRKVGVMFVNYRSPHQFSADESTNIELFANQAAVAVRNAQLHDEVQKRAENLNAVIRVSRSIISSLDLDRILTTACQAVVELLGVDHSGLVLFDKDQIHGKVYAEYPKLGALGTTFPLRDVPAEEELIRNLQPVIISDVEKEPAFDSVRSIHRDLGTHSMLIVPVTSKGKILGSFGLDNLSKDRVFTKEEIELCNVFAAQVAVAIENAQQYEELQKTKVILAARDALAWTGMISSTWRHTIEKHAITIREQVELLRRDVESLGENESIDKRLTMMERLSNQILEKPFTAPLTAEEGVSSISVNDFVKERLHQLWTHQPYKDVTLDMRLQLTSSATIRVSIEWLKRAIDILIDNAIDATEGMAERKILVISSEIDGRAEISIRDNGRGIAPEIRERLFREPIAKLKGAKGLGMGLLFAQMILQTYGGEIRVGETGPTGTVMVISLPLET